MILINAVNAADWSPAESLSHWWDRDIEGAHKLPLMLSFIAFVLTFAITRTVARLIRAGRGPFHDNVTTSGVHVHHAIPGIVLLTVGAFMAVGAGTSTAWRVPDATTPPRA
ncbi:hypothetical protein [Frankia sp. AgKG'84/4]|uniref:hypothetical protein n=1 Tax=Frankia sp. AgKG'84/4 TaxID=573490 RepID=UPI00202A2871|nr:hypothetical protein [Frankia sp. AgKG'84/4]MCL9793819.1 hypothetical protein [Frankia sp. AgKG'84/4]